MGVLIKVAWVLKWVLKGVTDKGFLSGKMGTEISQPVVQQFSLTLQNLVKSANVNSIVVLYHNAYT